MIEFESVGKTYRDGTVAVADLSLTVPSDKITVFVGPSGCGKTTTLRMVNRMIEPTAGRITWDGAPLRSKRKTTLRRQMGYVIQSGGLFPHRTVLENIGTVPALLHWDRNKIRKRSLELLSSVGLDTKLAHRYPAQLSGGQQQRVGVARALAADPLVMLMDEPFSAVDPVVRAELHELFLGLQRQLSKTIILITHDIDEAIKLGDQVAILRVGGRLAQVGTPQQLLDSPVDAFVEGFVGRDRGYRSLSFLPASDLELTGVRMVRDPQSAGLENTLVVDGDAKPLGWADRHHPGQLLPLGATFDPELDTLRLALDAALTSPYGLAVGVSRAAGGRFVGVANAREILSQISDARAASMEPISLSEATGNAAASGPGKPGSAEQGLPEGQSDSGQAVEDRPATSGEPADADRLAAFGISGVVGDSAEEKAKLPEGDAEADGTADERLSELGLSPETGEPVADLNRPPGGAHAQRELPDEEPLGELGLPVEDASRHDPPAHGAGQATTQGIGEVRAARPNQDTDGADGARSTQSLGSTRVEAPGDEDAGLDHGERPQGAEQGDPSPERSGPGWESVAEHEGVAADGDHPGPHESEARAG